jgi:hypothetical protein
MQIGPSKDHAVVHGSRFEGHADDGRVSAPSTRTLNNIPQRPLAVEHDVSLFACGRLCVRATLRAGNSRADGLPRKSRAS